MKDIVSIIDAAYMDHRRDVERLSTVRDAGGRIRTKNGHFVEAIVDAIVDHVRDSHGLTNVRSVKNDRISIRSASGYEKKHSVDRHIYVGDRLVHVIECKTYLDACYLERAYNDMRYFKKYVDPTVTTTVVALEDNCAESAKAFYADDFDNVIDGIFILMKGKRLSSRPMWMARFAKSLDPALLRKFASHVTTSITGGCCAS